jgi:hypothetical protein
LQFALDNNEDIGVWGNTSPKERRALSRAKRPMSILHGTESGYQAERRRSLEPCLACLDAHRAYEASRRAEWRARNKERQQEAS